MVTAEDLFRDCTPMRDIEAVISQLFPQVSALERQRNGESVQVPIPRDADDLRTHVKTALATSDVATFTPFELMARIHSTEGRTRQLEIASVEGPSKFTKEKAVIFREISAPIHKLDGSSFVVATSYIEEQYNPDVLERDYLRAMRDIQEKHPEELADQVLTYDDLIRVNRRLIDLDVRCFRCTNTRDVKCAKFDWVRRELL